MLRNRAIKNAGWIIVCKIAQAVLTLVVTMFTARFFGPSNFGLINYAASVIAFATPFALLGLPNTLVQEIVNNEEQEGLIVGTAILLCIFSSVICVFGVIIFVFLTNNGDTVSVVVCSLYSAVLLFQGTELVQYWFHAKLLSKYVSVVSLFAYSIYSAYRIFLLITGRSIYWFALSNALDKLIISCLLILLYTRKNRKMGFSFVLAKRLLHNSKYYIVANLMVVVFTQTDKVMLKTMLNNAATGYYSAAIACAGLADFVFAAIYDSSRSIIFDAKKRDDQLFQERIVQLFSIITYFSILYSLAITLLSHYIILIIYGKEYLGAVNTLRLVVWFTAFSNFGVIRNIWLLAEGKQKYLLRINTFGALFNVVMNYLTIPKFGIMGAAFSSLFTQFFSNVLLGFIIGEIKPLNNLMIQGINPKIVLNVLNTSIR